MIRHEHGTIVKAGRLLARSLFATFALFLSGCAGMEETGAPTTLTAQDPPDDKYFPSDEPYKLGAEYFNRGDFGVAERYFRDAVEKAPEDGSAWVALASSYDRLRRFDLADRAYQRAIAICGETVQILNNQGYSQMLRGNLKSARRKFMKAANLDPNNPFVLNNIKLLDGGGSLLPPNAGQM